MGRAGPRVRERSLHAGIRLSGHGRRFLRSQRGGGFAELLYILFIALLAFMAGSIAWLAFAGNLFDAWGEEYGSDITYAIPTFEAPSPFPTFDSSFLTPSPAADGE